MLGDFIFAGSSCCPYMLSLSSDSPWQTAFSVACSFSQSSSVFGALISLARILLFFFALTLLSLASTCSAQTFKVACSCVLFGELTPNSAIRITHNIICATTISENLWDLKSTPYILGRIQPKCRFLYILKYPRPCA